MVTRIALCTDDPQMAENVPRLFDELAEIRVYPRKNFVFDSEVLSQYDYFVLGVSSPGEADWRLCRVIVNEGLPQVYLMLGHSPSLYLRKRAEQIGIKEVLLDPLLKLRNMAEKEAELLSILKPAEADSPTDDPDLKYLGCNVYFHTKEYWAGSSDQKNQLSERETKLLKLFLANKGKIVSTDVIAKAVWGGHIEKNSVRKSIKRLREKLGDGKELIKGRKQGGYIYRGE
ncbi:MAG TPA: winged helix-turn-helix domain-containing protein [Bacillales bacterium]